MRTTSELAWQRPAPCRLLVAGAAAWRCYLLLEPAAGTTTFPRSQRPASRHHRRLCPPLRTAAPACGHYYTKVWVWAEQVCWPLHRHPLPRESRLHQDE